MWSKLIQAAGVVVCTLAGVDIATTGIDGPGVNGNIAAILASLGVTAAGLRMEGPLGKLLGIGKFIVSQHNESRLNGVQAKLNLIHDAVAEFGDDPAFAERWSACYSLMVQSLAAENEAKSTGVVKKTLTTGLLLALLLPGCSRFAEQPVGDPAATPAALVSLPVPGEPAAVVISEPIEAASVPESVATPDGWCIGDRVRLKPVDSPETAASVAHLPHDAWWTEGRIIDGPHAAGWWVEFADVTAWTPESLFYRSTGPPPEPEPIDDDLAPQPLPVDPVDPEPTPDEWWETLASFVEAGDYRTTSDLIAAVRVLAADGTLPDVKRLEAILPGVAITDANRATIAAILRGEPTASPFPSDAVRVLFVIEKTGIQPEHLREVKLWLIDANIEWRDLDDDLSADSIVQQPQWVRDAYAAKIAAPCIVVGGPNGGTVQPLPADAESILTLIRSYL